MLGYDSHAQQVRVHSNQQATAVLHGLSIPSRHPRRCTPPEGRAAQVEPRTTRRHPRVARLFPHRSCDRGSLRPLSTSPVGVRRKRPVNAFSIAEMMLLYSQVRCPETHGCSWTV